MEALKKSENIREVFFQMVVSTHEVVAKSKRVRYKRLLIIGEITHIHTCFIISAIIFKISKDSS